MDQAVDAAHQHRGGEHRVSQCESRVIGEECGDLLDEDVLQPLKIAAEAPRQGGVLEEHPVQVGLPTVQGDHGIDEAAQQGVDLHGLPPDLPHEIREQGGALLHVPLHQGHENGVLVGEVLVDGAHGHPGAFGDGIGGSPGVTAPLENLSRGGEDHGQRVARTRLAGLLAGL